MIMTVFQRRPNWIRVNYKARSLYSVIADNRYRRVSIGRNKWKSLIPGSSLQKYCNREGFNSKSTVTSLKAYDRSGVGYVKSQKLVWDRLCCYEEVETKYEDLDNLRLQI
ncbi:hypothetical protein AC249_AIPGENE13951 [Exaiptasia diaphana]|nr:hypothetical protein AC249_AIPGENE13951 [Exaiptasia diaphana]